MGSIKASASDAAVTFLWVFCSSTFGLLSSLIASALGLSHVAWASLCIITAIVFVFVLLFEFICDWFGGACFNPTGIVSFHAAGVGQDGLLSLALRFPAQAAGAVGGAWAVTEVTPLQYKHMLEGPSLRVDAHTGAVAEGILTCLISFAVLVIFLRGPHGRMMQSWLLAVVTVALVVMGSKYTGPAMNPAIAFGWAYMNHTHKTWEHFYVYWICPLLGALCAGWIYSTLFMQKIRKEKKA